MIQPGGTKSGNSIPDKSSEVQGPTGKNPGGGGAESTHWGKKKGNRKQTTTTGEREGKNIRGHGPKHLELGDSPRAPQGSLRLRKPDKGKTKDLAKKK